MQPRLLRIGASQNPVVVIDGFSGAVERIAGYAERLAPFPRSSSGYYPGVRRVLDEADGEAFAYAQASCRAAAQFIAGAFDIDRFDLLEASFSMVTAAPATLSPPQRAPHFDSADPYYLAMLHFLRVPEPTGTAFYRQVATGIEQVSDATADRFVAAAKASVSRLPAGAGYIQGSTGDFEQLAAIEAVPDRLLIYRGSLLHSGIVPPGMTLSADPGVGRLTTNFFLQGQRSEP